MTGSDGEGLAVVTKVIQLNYILRWLPLLLVVLLPACQSLRILSSSSTPLEYKQQFEGGRLAGWAEDDDAAWRIESGSYRVNTRGDAAAVALYTFAVWSNCLFEADVVRSKTTVGAAGLVVRSSRNFRGWASGSGYLFCLGSDGSDGQFAVLRQVDGAMDYVQKWAPCQAMNAVTNRLSVLARNDQFQFSVNGQLVWEGSDATLASGHIGLLGSTSDGQEVEHIFDQLSVQVEPGALEVPEPKTVVVDKDAPVADAAIQAPSSKEDKSPLLRPGLVVRITVLVSGKREIDAETVRVSDNNQLDLPLIGPVPAQGMTLLELNSTLQILYQDYFINPQVFADFVLEDRPDAISPWGSVVVLGRVRTPGRVNIPPTQDLTVSAAIQQAGGLDTSAKVTSVRVTRRSVEGSPEVFIIDFSAIGSRGRSENDLILRPGDLIFVPERVF